MAVSAQQPSPTESANCVSHGDHWDCPTASGSAAMSSATGHADDHDDHDDHASGSHSAGPSPTESVGCVSHGNHWDCDGPRESASGAVGSAASSAAAVATGAAGMNVVNFGVLAVVGAAGVLVL
ncbi:hypothetical protein BZA05DRAFT_442952 [Tricharina praecox]|uniref:uncharacterized protein n=1 Tax=Tricharina praecox TaxID=43433 RepID=UPI00221FFE0C|nr:uncharacterized protein BZA05DRAFT_442952 [Tricharina praecox]KAI5855283.1 hypothetical protein BZA05DRAFT_442952 [Tricharina praecox]